jgi:hypothetical protein
LVAKLFQHSRQRSHRGATDADQVNVFWRHGRFSLAGAATDDLCTAASQLNVTISAADNVARTPNGSVIALLET